MLAPSSESSCLYSDLWHKVTLGWRHRFRIQCLSQGSKMASQRRRLGHKSTWLSNTRLNTTDIISRKGSAKESKEVLCWLKGTQHSARKQTWSYPYITRGYMTVQWPDSHKTIRKHCKTAKKHIPNCGKQATSATGAQRRKPWVNLSVQEDTDGRTWTKPSGKQV